MRKFEKPTVDAVELDRVNVILTSGCSTDDSDYEKEKEGPKNTTFNMRINK